ncbi:MAG: DNA polymerase II large subunit, partial [Thermoprotei archaeon]
MCIDGEGTEDIEVVGHKDIPSVDTNKVRGGVCLVIAEGIILKAPKLLKAVDELKIDGWEFLKELRGGRSKKKSKKVKYMEEVLGGRPVFSLPGKEGGFRLRYGKGRTNGLAALAVHPSVMEVTDGFLAMGTQMKIEGPGKACIITPCDALEPPLVLLKNGDLVEANLEDMEDLRREVSQVVDLGEILVPYGEFKENNAQLRPGAFSVEWWRLEAREAGYSGPDPETAEEAFEISERYGIPLHPRYNLFWHDVAPEEVYRLAAHLKEHAEMRDGQLVVEMDQEVKGILVKLGALHRVRDGKIILDRYAQPVWRGCGLHTGSLPRRPEPGEDTLGYVSSVSGVIHKARAPTRIGARMGRPEKAKERKLKPPVNVLFPVGWEVGNQRLVKEAAGRKSITAEMGVWACRSCGRTTHKPLCSCGGRAVPTDRVKTFELNLAEELEAARRALSLSGIPLLKGVRGLTSRTKTPEMLEKGLLRAKHGLWVFKDGTVRFDATDAPVTHFKPEEIGTPVEVCRRLGYTHDVNGAPLERQDQVLELRVQDVIIPKSCAVYMFKVSRFVDELLEKFYGLEPYYRLRGPEDLIGHLIVALAPHTSAGVVGRVIGFTGYQVCYAHPFFHAIKRRNCDGDEDAIMLLLDVLLNFSKSYLPDKRGGHMDAPLVLNPYIVPEEIDKEALNLDAGDYPLEFYRAAEREESPKAVEDIMDFVEKRLGTPAQYEGLRYTVDTTTIHTGPDMSAYKKIDSMPEKVESQMRIASKLRAVNPTVVASKVIDTHLIRDIMGNLNKFSNQSFRCSKCGAKYRRVPITGTCVKCRLPLVLTVSPNSVKKYLSITKDIAQRFGVREYTKQRINVLERSIDSLFNNGKMEKTSLDDFGLTGYL